MNAAETQRDLTGGDCIIDGGCSLLEDRPVSHELFYGVKGPFLSPNKRKKIERRSPAGIHSEFTGPFGIRDTFDIIRHVTGLHLLRVENPTPRRVIDHHPLSL